MTARAQCMLSNGSIYIWHIDYSVPRSIAIALFELSSKTRSLAAQNPHAHSTIFKVKGT